MANCTDHKYNQLIVGSVILLTLIYGVQGKTATGHKKDVQERNSSESHKLEDSTSIRKYPWNDIRLPTSIIPRLYHIRMHPNLTTFTFHGSVKIIIKVKQTTDFIIFHSKRLNITNIELTRKNKHIPITRKLESTELQQVYLKLGTYLLKGQKCLLKMSFSGILSEITTGFYRSSYINGKGEKVWLATTQFQPTDARAAFPVFDEPQLKALFQMSIIRNKQHISLFNTEKKEEIRLANGLIEDVFAPSVKMSTYLVAFVICDFANITKTTKSGIKVSVYVQPNLIDDGQFALKAAVTLLDYYEKFFGSKFPMPKQDLICIPDTTGGAMENWGLIVFNPKYILVNPKESSSSDKQWVAVVVAHELGHQWFGNLVTMKWWNDLWLNEGFATFLQYIGADHVQPRWNMLGQFVADKVLAALHVDSLSTTHPISVEVEDPAAISQLFDRISFDKGAAVIGMLESVIGRTTLQNGLKKYFDKLQFKNAVTNDLWKAFQQAAAEDGLMLNIKQFMDTWTLQEGYPLITISRKKNKITATQERFQLEPVEGDQSPFNFKWRVPLTYFTDKNPDDTKLNWMNMGPVSFNIPDGVKWLKFNAGTTGFYRVNYGKKAWDVIIKQLITNHEVFSSDDRAGLISDIFALAKANIIETTTALELSRYLVKEKDYVPSREGLDNLASIGNRLQNTPGYQYYRDYVLDIIEDRISEVGFDDTGSHLQMLFRVRILHTAVTLNHSATVAAVQQKYEEWKQGTSVAPNLKSVVYSGGIEHGGTEEWDFAWQKYQNNQVPSDKNKLLAAMSNSKDTKILQRYLDYSLDEKKVPERDTLSIVYFVADNPIGRELAWNFLKNNWDVIFKRYGGVSFVMALFISGTTKRFKTQDKYDEVKAFFDGRDTGVGSRAVDEGLESIQLNIDWITNNGQATMEWLKQHTQRRG